MLLLPIECESCIVVKAQPFLLAYLRLLTVAPVKSTDCRVPDLEARQNQILSKGAIPGTGAELGAAERDRYRFTHPFMPVSAKWRKRRGFNLFPHDGKACLSEGTRRVQFYQRGRKLILKCTGVHYYEIDLGCLKTHTLPIRPS